MAFFAHGEELKEIGYSNFASQNNNPRLLNAVANNNTLRVSDSLVGAPLSTGNLQPTAGALGISLMDNTPLLGSGLVMGTALVVAASLRDRNIGERTMAFVMTGAVGFTLLRFLRGD